MLQPSSPKHHHSSKQRFRHRCEGEADAGGREQDFGAHGFQRTNGENKSSLRTLMIFTPRSPSFSNFSATQETAVCQLPTLVRTSQIRLPALLLASVWLLSPRRPFFSHRHRAQDHRWCHHRRSLHPNPSWGHVFLLPQYPKSFPSTRTSFLTFFPRFALNASSTESNKTTPKKEQ